MLKWNKSLRAQSKCNPEVNEVRARARESHRAKEIEK